MTRDEKQHEQHADNGPNTATPEDLPRFLFDVLARGSKEVLIDHNSQVYRLRLTKNGKLILNK